MIVAVFSGLSLVILCVVTYFVMKMLRFIDKSRQELQNFMTPPGKDQLSPFGKLTGAIAQQFANVILQQAKMTAMGNSSAESRQEKCVESAIGNDLLNQQAPMLGMIAQQFPSLGKAIRKNPNLAITALNMLNNKTPGSSLFGQVQPKVGAGNGHNSAFDEVQ